MTRRNIRPVEKAHKENTNHTVWRPKVDVRYSNDSESKNLLTYCLSLIHLNFRGFGEKSQEVVVSMQTYTRTGDPLHIVSLA